MCTAIDGVIGLDAMSDYPASTVLAGRSQRVYRALEGIEHVRLAPQDDVEGFVVFVSTYLASAHASLLSALRLTRHVSYVCHPAETGISLEEISGQAGQSVDAYEEVNQMGIGASIVLIAAGAVLFWAVETTVQGINLNAVGVILMVVGGIGLFVSFLYWDAMPWRRTRVIEREYRPPPEAAR
jgi:hypothetical protein